MNKLTVTTKHYNYEIIIADGLLHSAKQKIDQLSLGFKKVVIITDDNVEKFHLNKVSSQFPDCKTIVIQPGENSKNLNTVESIYEELLKFNFTREDLLIALGGGVVGDLTGFVAATYLRGVNFVNIPTTLLSQVDSSVGGKVGVNLNKYKNMIGSFYQPRLVLIDPEALSTLFDRERKSGMAEIIKIFMLKDRLAFKRLQEESAYQNINEYIYLAVKLKRDIVAMDTYERNIRTLLNFGHTIGHGLETYFNYELYNHGESVAIGMAQMTKGQPLVHQPLVEVLTKYDLSYELPNLDQDKFIDLLIKDKKMQANGKVRIILISQIGHGYLKDVTVEELKEFLQ